MICHRHRYWIVCVPNFTHKIMLLGVKWNAQGDRPSWLQQILHPNGSASFLLPNSCCCCLWMEDTSASIGCWSMSELLFSFYLSFLSIQIMIISDWRDNTSPHVTSPGTARGHNGHSVRPDDLINFCGLTNECGNGTYLHWVWLTVHYATYVLIIPILPAKYLQDN